MIDTKPAGYRDRLNLVYEQTYQDDEITKTNHKYADGTYRKTVKKWCKAKLNGEVMDKCRYNLVPQGEWNKTWAEVEAELDQTLPHVGHPSVVHRETNTWEDIIGRVYTDSLVVIEQYNFTKTRAESQGQHASLAIAHCFEATVQQDFSVGAYDLNYGVSANWSASTEYSYGYSPPSSLDGRVWQIRGYQKHYRVWAQCSRTRIGPLERVVFSSTDDTGWEPLEHCVEGVRWRCSE